VWLGWQSVQVLQGPIKIQIDLGHVYKKGLEMSEAEQAALTQEGLKDPAVVQQKYVTGHNQNFQLLPVTWGSPNVLPFKI